MAEEEKPKQLVQMSTVLASGITAIVAALFTARLGVAGTLIGTALTPMLMTIGVAVLNAQIQKATEKISDLPSTVRGQLPTQRVRVPGTPSPEPPPEEPEPLATPRRRDRRAPGAIERLLSIPTYLKEMAPSTRRKTLLTGAAAGLIAAIIGLAGVTGLEAASGGTLSCTLYEECSSTAPGQETAQTGTSLSRAFGGSAGPETQYVPAGSEGLPAGGQRPEAPPAPDATPQNGQYEDGSQNPGEQAPSAEEAPQALPEDPAQQQPEQPAVPQDPSAAPQDGSEQPTAIPDAEQQPAVPSEQQQQQ